MMGLQCKACGMTIEAQIRNSVYNGVSAWPIEEAREVLAGIRARGQRAPQVQS